MDPDTGLDAFGWYAIYGRGEKLLWILERLPPSFIIQKGHPTNKISSTFVQTTISRPW
jgi:hypothetical protein